MSEESRTGNALEGGGGGHRGSAFSAPVDAEELEFIQAIEAFKRDNDRPFPSWSEVLRVLKGLGYTR